MALICKFFCSFEILLWSFTLNSPIKKNDEKIKKITKDKINSNFVFFKNKIDGMRKNVIVVKFKPYVPRNEVTWIYEMLFDKEYTNKFHGKPVKIWPLINSNIPRISEKIKIKVKFLNLCKKDNK